MNDKLFLTQVEVDLFVDAILSRMEDTFEKVLGEIGDSKPCSEALETIRSYIESSLYFESVVPNLRDVDLMSAAQVRARDIGSNGISLKFSNVFLDLPKLAGFAAETTLASICATSCPWIIPLVGISALTSFRGLLCHELKGHAVSVLWIMWKKADAVCRVREDGLLNALNLARQKAGYHALSVQEFENAIRDLEKAHCIVLERDSSGRVWQLCERIRLDLKECKRIAGS